MAYIADKNILFVHIPKNAGKSIEAALDLLGGSSFKALGGRHSANRLFTYFQRRTRNVDAARVLHGTLDVALCAQHLTLQEIQLLRFLPDTARDGLRSFCVCRNPWDRALSTYRHFRAVKDPDPAKFEAFCGQWYDQPARDHNELAHQRLQIDFILDVRGRPGVDRILRFESLASDFSLLCADWALDATKLPHIGKQGTGAAYQIFYTDRAKEIIAERFAEDVEYFGYEF